MTSKHPINLKNLLQQRKIEGERIEYKTGWNPDPIMHTLCSFANDFENLGWCIMQDLLPSKVRVTPLLEDGTP